jgi:hypothetical protein
VNHGGLNPQKKEATNQGDDSKRYNEEPHEDRNKAWILKGTRREISDKKADNLQGQKAYLDLWPNL